MRIRTGMGKEVTMLNALLLTTVKKKNSRAVRGRGYIVDTTLTIGYHTPWRELESMMIDAARRTLAVPASPAPRVFQTARPGFHVEYRLLCQAVPNEPRPRAEVRATLHQHLLDVFNEREVQIMSPQYFSEPAEPKLVFPRVPPLVAGARHAAG